MTDTIEARSPRDVTAACEGAETALRKEPGRLESFSGWGVMGLTFDSGHVLGLRRFPYSSIGPGYTSVWHRSPEGRWSFWSTIPGDLSCARYAAGTSLDTGETAIDLAWPAPDHLTVTAEAVGLVWDLRFISTTMTRSLGALARRLPERVGRRKSALWLLGQAAGPLLRAGPLALTGRMPNGQTFHVMPAHLWRVAGSQATIRSEGLGVPAPLPDQAMLGDFRIPQQGLLAVAAVDFAPTSPWTTCGTVPQGVPH